MGIILAGMWYPSTQESAPLLNGKEKEEYTVDLEGSAIAYSTPTKIKQETNFDAIAASPDDALCFFANRGDIDGIRTSVKKGAQLNADCDGDGDDPIDGNNPLSHDFPLHLAVEGGFLEAVNELIELKADLEVVNRVGSTPLHRACSNNQVEIVHKLLKEGANPFAINKIGNTALHCAAYGGFVDVAKYLLEFSAAPCLKSQNLIGLTPIQVAEMGHNRPVLDLFSRYKQRKKHAEAETSISFVDTVVNDGEDHPSTVDSLDVLTPYWNWTVTEDRKDTGTRSCHTTPTKELKGPTYVQTPLRFKNQTRRPSEDSLDGPRIGTPSKQREREVMTLKPQTLTPHRSPRHFERSPRRPRSPRQSPGTPHGSRIEARTRRAVSHINSILST